jgi:signal transduction histidine kinase
VIRNLVANALKHGGPTVAVSVAESGTEGAVHVTDAGAGPSPEIEALMFDAFVSGHVPDGRPGSFGLGLSISRRLARAMGGDVRYDRVEGHTRFSLHLPLATD